MANEIIQFPNLLPLPRRADYKVQPEDTRRKTEMEDGVRVRQEYPDDPSLIPVSWALTPEQAAIFEAWEKHTLRGGSKWFEVPLMSAAGFSPHVVRFENRPDFDFVDAFGVVKAVLRVEERRTLAADEVAGVMELGGFDQLGANELHQIIHADLPGPLNW